MDLDITMFKRDDAEEQREIAMRDLRDASRFLLATVIETDLGPKCKIEMHVKDGADVIALVHAINAHIQEIHRGL
jgi:hypothetical protein